MFRLEPASTEVVEQLVHLRFPEMSLVNSGIIAKNSGGNARIAIALAQTVGESECLAGFSDRTLFLRLFQQRHPHDTSLLVAAEACSLTYSFDTETLTGDAAELPRLATMASLPPKEVYRHVAELVRRGLVQGRGKWRAVLPQAIADHLAERALENIPQHEIETNLVHGAPDRLVRSFSRRLGYLHRSPTAVRLAEAWLAPKGMLADVANLDDLKLAIFINVAPLSPAVTLAALERAADGPEGASIFVRMAGHGSSVTDLLRPLAFDAILFDRSAALLAGAALAEDHENKVNNVVDLFASLFTIVLSGTHATVAQRASVIDGLLRSKEERQQDLGIKALGAALEGCNISSVHDFGFGARSRDHGYEPRTWADVLEWYGAFIELCQTYGCDVEKPIAQRVRAALAQHFHELWRAAGVHDLLESVAHAFAKSGRWDDGWIAVRQILGLEQKILEVDERERLQSLAALLAPKSLADRVKTYVLSPWSLFHDNPEDESGDITSTSMSQAFSQARTTVEDLGSELAVDAELFGKFLPDLVRYKNDVTPLLDFGRGLARAAADPGTMWQNLVGALGQAPQASACPVVLNGFLDGLRARDAKLAATFLDGAVHHEVLARWFPLLQSDMAVDRAGLDRLFRSLQLGSIQTRDYFPLKYCTLAEDITEEELASFVEAIAAKQDGMGVALEILATRLQLSRNAGRPGLALIATGRNLMATLVTGDIPKRKSRMFAALVEACTASQEGKAIAENICQLLAGDADGSSFDHGLVDTITALLKTQPDIALTAFLKQNGPRRMALGQSLFGRLELFGRNPIHELASDVVLAWCDRDPAMNYPLAAACVRFEGVVMDTGGPSWTATAIVLMERAPDRLAVLKNFVARFQPRSWSGSRLAILSRRLQLLDLFVEDRDPEIADYARSARDNLERDAAQERDWEISRSKEGDERFE